MLKRRPRAGRPELDETALAMIARHGAEILATARRYAATAEDAEDAYQRGLEILLTKAPTTSEADLIPWLKTVVKHEAFALRRQRDRHSPVTDDGRLGDRPTSVGFTHEQATRLEQLSQGAEALQELKPHEMQALLLKAEGYTYREIGELTGWSYTKVNRLLTEGRRAFLARVAAIQGGGECARYEPLLSALADGEAHPEDLAVLRPHMRTCLTCRARLREFRELPARVAALAPPAALAADGGGLRTALESAIGSTQQKLDGVLTVAQHKTAVLGERAHAAIELAAGQKLVAVAASAAALAGGGAAVDGLATDGAAAPPAQTTPAPVEEETATVEAAPAPAADTGPITPEREPVADPLPEPAPPAPPPPPPPDPANEFAPGGAAPVAPAPAASTPAPNVQATPAQPPPPPSTSPAGRGPGGSSEFAP